MKALFSFLLALTGGSIFLLPELLHDACPYLAEIGMRSPLAVFTAWATLAFGVMLRPSAFLLAGFLVLTTRGVHTPEHESLTAAVWFLSGLTFLPFVWVARDVESL